MSENIKYCPHGVMLPLTCAVCAETSAVVAWRRRPIGSNRGWTYFDEAEDLEFYLASGRYDVQALKVAD